MRTSLRTEGAAGFRSGICGGRQGGIYVGVGLGDVEALFQDLCERCAR